MKKLTVILATILLPAVLLGQFNPPGCNDLTVENIQMDDDTANLMKITISNSCTSCTSGLNGCVYEELRVVKTVSPFDTIAASNCFCLWSPDNSSQRMYSINSTVTSFPPLTDIRVSLMSCECDIIPFSTTLGVLSNEISDSINIYPNPMVNEFTIQNKSSQQF
ncbi:MAG: hypothetical protein JJE25_02275 [Bacteroidia bacterium]|nr:hypothetical protein [Bacteroidia bacterium]